MILIRSSDSLFLFHHNSFTSDLCHHTDRPWFNCCYSVPGRFHHVPDMEKEKRRIQSKETKRKMEEKCEFTFSHLCLPGRNWDDKLVVSNR